MKLIKNNIELILSLIILFLMITISGLAHGQSFDLPCASGSQPLLAPTFNPSTGNLRCWVAVDPFGTVTSPVFGTGTGTVTSVSVVTANGVSGSVATATTTPAITLTLSAITPTSTNGVLAATMAFMDATSSVQTQLNAKAPLASPTFTGTTTFPGTGKITGGSGFTAFSVPTGVELSFGTPSDAINIGPFTSGTDTLGINIVGAAGSDIFVDCTDAACTTPLSGIRMLSPNASFVTQLDNTGFFATNILKPTQIAGQATAGTFGTPVVVGSSTLTGRTTALGTTTVYTVGAAVQTLAIHAIVNCDTSVATATATLTVVYTDSSNTAISTTGTGAVCTTLGLAAQQSINLPLIRARNATVVSWAIAIANSPNFDASIQVERYQ